MILRIISLSLILFMAANASADLVGHWKFDEASGTTAVDSSGKNNNGTVYGSPSWITGKFGGALQFRGSSTNTDYVQVQRTVQDDMTLMCWIKTSTDGAAGTPAAAWRGTGLFWSDVSGSANDFVLAVYGKKLMFSTREDQAGPTTKDVVTGDWVHVAVTRVAGTDLIKLFINGQMDTQFTGTTTASLTANANINIGANTLDTRYYTGLIDDVRFYTNVLTIEEIQLVMVNNTAGAASKPEPYDGATDIGRDVVLGWKSGTFIAEGGTHNVFFGTDFNDVNDATTTNTLGVTVSAGQPLDVNTFNPGTLQLGVTYYWRIDEVNAPSSPGTNKGFVWSFTVEPVALNLLKEFITVAVNKPNPGSDPNNTFNGVGLDPNTDLHSTAGCWISGTANAADPVWIRYDFDKLYKIHEMFVWNYNAKLQSKYGFKQVLIQYSTDGSSWTDLNTVTEFAKGKGDVGNDCDAVVPFNDIVASSVRITALSTHETNTYTKAGLAEVRFTYIPTYARIPSPVTGDTGVVIDRILSWRPGREADKHDVYISTDSVAVLNHSVPAHTVTVNNYSPLLDFGKTYYWSVTEVSNTMTPSRWVGDIWDFTTAEYGSLDDFEDYNGVTGREIWSFWIDGFDSITNGSIMGLSNSPYVEKTIVQHGAQSAPISYDNTGIAEPAATYSEVTRTFDTALNLKVSGADSLKLYYRGQAIKFGELSGYIAMSGEGTDIQSTADQFRYAYKTLTGNGSIVARVDSIQNVNAWSKAGIMIRNTLDANSVHATAVLGALGTLEFQRRTTKGGTTTNTDVTGLRNPYWVKITRSGSTFKAERSADGINWLSFETDPNTPTTVTITMNNQVYIGLAVTSHTADVLAAATFSGVATTGTISTGAWTVAPIGDATQADGLNTIDALYVVVEDSTGKKAKIYAPGNAVGAGSWCEWLLPYSQFTGVDMSKVKKLTIGVGDAAATAKGKGNIYIDNISYGHTIVK